MNQINSFSQNQHNIETSTSADSINPSLSAAQICKANQYYLYDDILLQRHKRALPTKEAYLFFPTKLDQIIENPNKPELTLRMIFTNVVFLEFENLKLRELNERIIHLNNKNPLNKIEFPPWWKESDSRRFLQATGYNLDKTIDYITKQIQWKKTFFPFQINDNTISILNSGFMYICGRDCHYRPVFIIHAKSYFDLRDKFSYQEIFMAIIFFLEYVINNMMIVGQIENWIMITDITKVSLLRMPHDLKKIVSTLSSTYRCRLYKNYIIGMNAGLRFIAKIFMAFLEPVTANKIAFLDEGNKIRELTTFINPNVIEEKYGGKAPNIQPGPHTFFPPVMPSLDFSKDGINLIITEEEYKKKCNSKDNKPYVMCQELLDKWEEERKREEIMKEEKEKEEKLLQEHKELQQSARMKSSKTLIINPIDILSWRKDENNEIQNNTNVIVNNDNKNENENVVNNNNNEFNILNEDVNCYFKTKQYNRDKSVKGYRTMKSKCSHKGAFGTSNGIGKIIGMRSINDSTPRLFGAKEC